ncbi:unnamed protein product [Callosobruchus maculatus]|uniref:C2 domain-containing protein n=1 Tax=Callosobruchus maculatus TaxID=64391 RepID=A0A653D804_CALMS|nr:unnamed protein product [Callosobruchus maculatus]
MGDEDFVKQVQTLKVYDTELEKQPEFKGFTDKLTTFEMYKGKRTGDDTIDEEKVTGIFKGCIKIYRWPLDDDEQYVTPEGNLLADGYFKRFSDNTPMGYTLRVYCIRALGLRPKDITGKSDPYLVLTLNDKVINDRDNYVVRQVNPVFGRCFEFIAAFPFDHMLKISLYDYDVVTGDDMIGETKIDVEGRYYTKHRAGWGLPESYEEEGYCEWKGQQKPSAILGEICRINNLCRPEYLEKSVVIGFKHFSPRQFEASEDPDFDREVLALCALRHWQEMPVVGYHLVPEYVETRSLYDPSKPGQAPVMGGHFADNRTASPHANRYSPKKANSVRA